MEKLFINSTTPLIDYYFEIVATARGADWCIRPSVAADYAHLKEALPEARLKDYDIESDEPSFDLGYILVSSEVFAQLGKEMVLVYLNRFALGEWGSVGDGVDRGGQRWSTLRLTSEIYLIICRGPIRDKRPCTFMRFAHERLESRINAALREQSLKSINRGRWGCANLGSLETQKIPGTAEREYGSFTLGKVFITPAALEVLNLDDVYIKLTMHARCDWQECNGSNYCENNFALGRRLRFVSDWNDRNSKKFLIITDADRRGTTILLPEDYQIKRRTQPVPRISSVAISAMPKSFADPLPAIHVTYDNATDEDLFTYYPDEISFREEEFIGLTHDQALALRHKKDVAYLRS